MKWMIDLVQEVTDTPICVDSPSARSCVAAIPFCKRPGLINSVSLEGDKIDTIFPVIADTDWECVALLCDNDGIPDSVERRMKIFFGIMEKAKQYGIAPSRLHIDPLVVTLGTDQTALTVFADCCRRIKYEYPEIHITSGLSNISFGLPVRKNINQAFMVLAMNAGMDSAIVDPTNKNMIGMIYATNALLERDEYCLQYIDKFGIKASEEAAQPAPASPLDEKMQKVFKLTQDGKNKEIGQAVQEALDAGCDPTAILNDAMIGAMAVVGDNFKKEIILEHIRDVTAEGIRRIKLIDATPIGINVRSTVATYAGVHDELRKLYAKSEDAKNKGYKARDFSYNTGSLRCSGCDGTGVVSLDVQFLPDVNIQCPDCHGSRYSRIAYDVKLTNKAGESASLPELMDMDVNTAVEFCKDIKTVSQKLNTLKQLGLGYLTLGEETPSLSGGEAQRLKLASEIGKIQSDSVFIFDEPSIGLHPLDVQVLLKVFQALLDNGATVIVIEHDLDVIRNADYVIDMGPGGGENGGKIIASGTPQEIKLNKKSITGRYL